MGKRDADDRNDLNALLQALKEGPIFAEDGEPPSSRKRRASRARKPPGSRRAARPATSLRKGDSRPARTARAQKKAAGTTGRNKAGDKRNVSSFASPGDVNFDWDGDEGESPCGAAEQTRVENAARNAAPASKVIFGRQLRDDSDIAHIEIPPEFRVDPAKVHVDSLMVEQLSDIAEFPVEWLWRDRFPLGRLSLLAGDPGIGKSLVALDIAARVSCGAPWPDVPGQAQEPGSVIIFSMEDNLSDTIKPRLIRAGADCRRTYVVEGVFNRPPYLDLQWKRRFRIREDLLSLKELVKAAYPVRLIVLDPIAAYCGTGDGGGMSVVHSMLSPLLEMAANCGISILCTTHLRGASGKAVYRAARHLSFTTAARAVWSIVRDARDSTRRLMVPVKINLGPDVEGLAFRIDAEGKVVWESEPVNLSADRALEAEREASKLDRTIEWLRGVLKEGPQEATVLFEEGKERGFSESTIRRAAASVGVTTDLKGYQSDRTSLWSLKQRIS